MLKKIILRNFKSFRDSTFELGPLTLMVGANASGKSNFVDALRFLQGCARGLTLSEIFSGKWEGGQRVWIPIRGGEQEVFDLFEKQGFFLIDLHRELTHSTNAINNGNYRLIIGQRDKKLAILQEQFVVGDHEFYGPPSEGEDVWTKLLVMSKTTSEVPEKIRDIIYIFKTWLSNLNFFDPTPSLMRDYVSQNHSEIGQRGENLSAALFKLASDSQQGQTVLEWIQELCQQEITKFEFDETRLGEVLLFLKEPNGVTISARSISDGTLRFLAIIVAMLTAKEGTTFIIEEIDNDLHPSRLHLLINFLEQVTASRKLQVIASTHSPYLLDHLSEESLNNVLVFHRDAQSVETKVIKLVEIPGYAEARKNMPLDLMHASSWMEQNL